MSRKGSPKSSPGYQEAPKLQRPKTPVTIYERAIAKISEAAYKFQKDKDGLWLQSFEGSTISKKIFLDSLKIGINCKLTDEELVSVMKHFECDGAIDGTKFSLWFYRLRFETKSKLQSDLISYNRKVQQAKVAEELAIAKEADDRIYSAKVDMDFTINDKTSAFEKVREAAFKYDRLMPGAVQLDGFNTLGMTPPVFKDQLCRCFSIQLSSKELGALTDHFDKDKSGNINCQDFLVTFFRMGFDEKSRRLKEYRDEEKRLKEEREYKVKEEQAQLAKKNSLKVSYIFSKADKDSALKKLREAARLTDTSGGAMKAFETKFMQPHEFKEQLKRVFNLKITAPELGALMKIFDVDGDGTITCAEFSKIFCSMGHAEREREIKEYREKQKRAEEVRAAKQKAKDDALAAKNASKLSYDYDEDSFQSALTKLTEAAWAYDKNTPGAPNLAAFEAKEMEPHVFADQLKRAFSMKLNPPELGALMTIFDPEQTGYVTCQNFLNKFLKVGMGERARRRKQWADLEIEREKTRIKAAEDKKRADDEKHFIQVDKNFSAEDFQSAMQKLVTAAAKFEKSAVGAPSLTAFDAHTMQPHIFKEQLRSCFGIKVSLQELSAILHYFGHDDYLECKDFVIRFVKMGLDERSKMMIKWRIEDKARREKALADEQAALERNGLRGEVKIDFNFKEEDFNSALEKLINMAYSFDSRNAGPGFKKILEVNFLRPGEFKETLKRVFNVKVNPSELGVLVSYFDLSMSGVVSTSAFMSSFMKMRISINDFKGQSNEKDLLKEYHSELKTAYEKRIARLSDKDGTWRQGGKLEAFTRKNKKPYPKNAAHKLRRRLNIAMKTGKLDLASQYLWNVEDTCNKDLLKTSNKSPSEEKVVAYDINDSDNLNADSLKAEVKELIKKPNAVDLAAQRKSLLQKKILEDLKQLGEYIEITNTERTISTSNIIKNVHVYDGNERKALGAKHGELDINELVEKHTREVVNFRLNRIPSEVFNMLTLTEMWLCGNELGSIPADIKVFKQLKVISLERNSLEELPVEIGQLENLTKAYLQNNQLMTLPAEFGNLRNLTECNISINRFEELPDCLCSLSQLVRLEAHGNEGISSLPISLKNLRSLMLLNLANCSVVSPEPVLAKMYWCHVVPSCMVMADDTEKPPLEKKSAVPWKIDYDTWSTCQLFLSSKAKSRVAKACAEKDFFNREGIMPPKLKKYKEKIVLR